MLDILRAAVDAVYVVSSEALALPELDATVVVDREPELGPLAGIREGLSALAEERAFVVATDTPFLTEEFVRALLGVSDAAAAQDGEGIVQPLAAVYPARGAEIAERLLARGERRPKALLEALSFRAVGADALPAVQSLRGFNTPREYLDAVRSVAPGAHAAVEFFGRPRLALGERRREAPIDTLGALLAKAAPEIDWLDGGELSREYLVSLDGRAFVRGLEIPVGPDETIIVLDAPAGG
jgi:molybdopterin-guanine dinucleotide biosynthesis protein A